MDRGNPSNVWSAHQLAEFVAGMADHQDLTRAVNAAIDQVCETFDAEFGAIVDQDQVLGSTGFGLHAHRLDGLIGQLVTQEATHLDVPGAGRCGVLVRSHVLDDRPCYLIAARREPAKFTVEEQSLLRNMSRVLAMSLRTFRLLNSLRERQRLLERLSVIQRSIARRAGLDNVLSAIVTGVVDLLDADAAVIRLVDKDSPNDHVLVASHGLSETLARRLERIPIDAGPPGRALKEGRLVIDTPADRDGADGHQLHELGQMLMAAPVHESGVNTGAIMVGFHDVTRGPFTEGEQEALGLFAEHASIALTDARAVEAMELAMYDPLTHLPNRVLFRDQLARARGERTDHVTSAVLFVDLDGFKAVNDTLGHGAGDDLLTDVGLRLTWMVRPADMVARHGGDEFTVLLQHLTDVAEAQEVAGRIIAGFREPFTVAGRPVTLGASIGIALDDGDPQTDLVERADRAMYAAKNRGRGRYEVFTDDTDAQAMQWWSPTL